MPIFQCLCINYKEMRYLAYPKRLSLNSLGRDLIYHLGFFINWYANFLIFPFDCYIFAMSKSVFLPAAMNFRRRSICLHPIRLAGFRDLWRSKLLCCFWGRGKSSDTRGILLIPPKRINIYYHVLFSINI